MKHRWLISPLSLGSILVVVLLWIATAGTQLVALAEGPRFPAHPELSAADPITHTIHLPLMARNYLPPDSVAGRVVDEDQTPVSGVTVTSDWGSTATTGANGYYTLSGLATGAHMVVPHKDGYTFSPTSFAVDVPSSSTSGDFVAAPSSFCDSSRLQNGDFEADTYWEVTQTGYATEASFAGSRSLRVGIMRAADNTAMQSSALQLVTIPSDATSAILRFRQYPLTEETVVLGKLATPGMANPRMATPGTATTVIAAGQAIDVDKQYVTILDQNGVYIDKLFAERRNDQTWILRQFDLTRYRGQSIQVYFAVDNDGKGGITGMYVDDVALEVSYQSSYYYVSGWVSDEDNNGLPGVTISSDTGHSTTTDYNGYYNLGSQTAGYHYITPYLSGHTFSPASRWVYVQSNIPGIDFSSAINYGGAYAVSGRVTDGYNNPLPGVTISSDTGHSTTTDYNGYYYLGSQTAGYHTITPYLSGSTFSPTSRSVYVPSSSTGIDFTGPTSTTGPYSVSGRVTDAYYNPLSGVTISSDTGHSTTTDYNGYYNLGGQTTGYHTITPYKSSYSFSPTSRSVYVPSSASGQDFTGTTSSAGAYSISGRVTDVYYNPISGASISSDTGHSTTTDYNGYYTLGGQTAGYHTITPYKSGYSFSPTSRSVYVPPNASGQDFTVGGGTAACAEGVGNGGFEYYGNWEIPYTAYPGSYTSSVARSGSRSMRVGIVNSYDNRYSYSSARQWVTIPHNTSSATLRFSIQSRSTELSASHARLQAPARPLAATVEEANLSGDAQYVLILDEREEWVGTLLWHLSDDWSWTSHEFDLTGYAGRTIKLHFGAYNNGSGGVAGLYVDDVSLSICTHW